MNFRLYSLLNVRKDACLIFLFEFQIINYNSVDLVYLSS